MPATDLTVRNLLPDGLIPYGTALALQRDLVQLRQREEIGDTLLLLQHPPTVTYGKTARPENLRLSPERYVEAGIELIATDRGGDVTYHGPGQIVGYPIIHLGEGCRDIHRYVRALEDVLIAVARAYGVEDADRASFHAGVWVGDGYLAALGVRVSRWVTHHGFALNVTEDVRAGFETIVPCGVEDKRIATLRQWSKIPFEVPDVADEIALQFAKVHKSSLLPSACLP